jgi:hypothetical protein
MDSFSFLINFLSIAIPIKSEVMLLVTELSHEHNYFEKDKNKHPDNMIIFNDQ